MVVGAGGGEACFVGACAAGPWVATLGAAATAGVLLGAAATAAAGAADAELLLVLLCFLSFDSGSDNCNKIQA